MVGALLFFTPGNTSAAAAAASAWSITPSPNDGTAGSDLNNVSCASAVSCQAVGSYNVNSNGATNTLIESWNGTSWSIIPSPNKATGNPPINELSSVWCVSATSCQAVGSYTVNSNGDFKTLIESWDGDSWSITPSPDKGTVGSALDGVFCLSETSCQAVGYYATSSDVDRTLVESWNGTSWSIIPSPNKTSGTYALNLLNSIWCTSADSCQAVGYDATSSGVGKTLVESWNGTSWSAIPSPNEGTYGNFLDGISCTSATSCQAVGEWADAEGAAGRTFAESWNGTSWSVVTTPEKGIDSALDGVSCASATSCQAVGSYGTTSGGSKTLIESWDGTSWSITSSPNTGKAQNSLLSVSCASTASCQAIGVYSTSNFISNTLIEARG